MRFPDVDRWSKEAVQKVNAYPWSSKDNREARIELGQLRQALRDQEVEEPEALRRMRINPSDIERYGMTPGCRQCDHVRRTGQTRPGITHSDECRARMLSEIAKSDEGRSRIGTHEERITARTVLHFHA